MKLFIYARAVILMLFAAFHTLLSSAVAIIQNLIFNRRDFDDFIIKDFWAHTILKGCGVDVEVRGEEQLPDRGCLFLFNHTSYMDIVIVLGSLKVVPRFGAKIELFKIPLFGLAMKRVGMLPIARHRREAVLRIYKEAEERVAQGECFALAPEGTRQDTCEIGRFKTGPFIFAIGAQMPIVPLVIAGAMDIQPKGQFLVNTKSWSSKVLMDVGSPIETKGLTQDDVADLQQKVRDQMVDTYARLNKELGNSIQNGAQIES